MRDGRRIRKPSPDNAEPAALLNRLLTQFSRARAETGAPARDDAALRERLRLWIAADEAPPYDLRELAVHPRRLQAAALLAEGAPAQEVADELEGLDEPVDHLLRAEARLRQGDAGAEAALPALADTTPAVAARAMAMLARRAWDRGDFAMAKTWAERLAASAPQTTAGCTLLARVREFEDRRDEALALFRRANTLRPASLPAIGELAAALIARGELRDGLTAWVMADGFARAYPGSDVCPVWDGRPLGHERLLVITSYGFGDILQFLRFAAHLREREPDARIEVQITPALARLAQASGLFDAVHDTPVPRAGYDWQVAQTRLPLALDLDMAALKRHLPYLRIAEADRAPARAWLPPRRAGVKRVGLRWFGRPLDFDAKRSVPFDALRPLFDVAGIEWVALAEDAQALARVAPHPLMDVSGHLRDFYATGALMAGLDLVISVDTAVVHLSGALGLPVWMIARPDPEWRWGASGETSPWYDSVRVFRHPPRGFDWAAVVNDLGQALRAWAER